MRSQLELGLGSLEAGLVALGSWDVVYFSFVASTDFSLVEFPALAYLWNLVFRACGQALGAYYHVACLLVYS